jgi:hypothetical protein
MRAATACQPSERFIGQGGDWMQGLVARGEDRRYVFMYIRMCMCTQMYVLVLLGCMLSFIARRDEEKYKQTNTQMYMLAMHACISFEHGTDSI